MADIAAEAENFPTWVGVEVFFQEVEVEAEVEVEVADGRVPVNLDAQTRKRWILPERVVLGKSAAWSKRLDAIHGPVHTWRKSRQCLDLASRGTRTGIGAPTAASTQACLAQPSAVGIELMRATRHAERSTRKGFHPQNTSNWDLEPSLEDTREFGSTEGTETHTSRTTQREFAPLGVLGETTDMASETYSHPHPWQLHYSTDRLVCAPYCKRTAILFLNCFFGLES